MNRATFTSTLSHLLAGCLFLVLAVVWTFPLVLHLSSSIPGVLGDNVSFLWNSWWMREFVQGRTSSAFLTDRLFAPFGINLVQNTHTALPSWVSATLFAKLPLVTAHNLTLLASLTANGICAYALAFTRFRDRSAAIVAGLIFAGSPYLSIHLLGHVNLINAWGIPLFLLCFMRTLETNSATSAVLTGLVGAAVGYTDYYYLIYCAALSVMLAGSEMTTWRFHFSRASLSSAFRTLLLLLFVVDVALILWIAFSGGFETAVGGIRVTARSITNLLSAGWVLGAIYGLARFRPSIEVEFDRLSLARCLKGFLVTWAIVLIGLLPIDRHAWSLWTAGEYVSPRASWRSGPGGVDLATVFLGNPLNPASGGVTRRLYALFNVDLIEESAWLGLAPLVLLWQARRLVAGDREVRRWAWVGALFFIFALGPWLRVAGMKTGLLLPQNLLAFIPVLSNARIPGRAIVVVMVAVSLVCAAVLARLNGRRRRVMLAMSFVLIAVDFLPIPFQLTSTEVPSIYQRLAGDLSAAELCALPMGLRDGFSSVGAFDQRDLLYQTTHGHAMLGGFAARIPQDLQQRYAAAPVLRSLISLSAGRAIEVADDKLTRAEIIDAFHQLQIRYVLLNVETAPEQLARYVHSTLPLHLEVREGNRELYSVVDN